MMKPTKNDPSTFTNNVPTGVGASAMRWTAPLSANRATPPTALPPATYAVNRPISDCTSLAPLVACRSGRSSSLVRHIRRRVALWPVVFFAGEIGTCARIDIRGYIQRLLVSEQSWIVERHVPTDERGGGQMARHAGADRIRVGSPNWRGGCSGVPPSRPPLTPRP